MQVLIIEDRIGRLRSFVDFDLESFSEFKIVTENDFDDLLTQLKDGNMNSLDDYVCIASHRSALSNEIRDILKEYCRKMVKPLIFFSGGISASVFKDGSFPYLLINSKDFYSVNLKLFVQHLRSKNEVNLLIIQFGIRWKMNLLLKLRNDLAVAGNNGTIKRVSDLKINSLIKEDVLNERTSFLTGNQFASVSIEQVRELRTTIDRVINHLL